MSLRHTVYCKRSVAHLTPEQLLAGLNSADLHTIAEQDDIPDETIVAALGQLRVENVDPNGFRFYRLNYHPLGLRPIDIERWQTPEEVRGVVDEVVEGLEGGVHPALARIRVHLGQAVDVVDVSFGQDEMAPVLASEAAR